MTQLLLVLGLNLVLFVSSTNVELGPRFAEVWTNEMASVPFLGGPFRVAINPHTS